MSKPKNIAELFGIDHISILNPYRDIEKPEHYADFANANPVLSFVHEHPENYWYIPDDCSGSDYSGAIYTKSNLQQILEICEENNIEHAHEIYGGYSSYGIAIRGDVACEKLIDAFCALANYPVLDEEHFSELEHEAEIEAWENWAKGEFINLLEKYFEEIWCTGVMRRGFMNIKTQLLMLRK